MPLLIHPPWHKLQQFLLFRKLKISHLHLTEPLLIYLFFLAPCTVAVHPHAFFSLPLWRHLCWHFRAVTTLTPAITPLRLYRGRRRCVKCHTLQEITALMACWTFGVWPRVAERLQTLLWRLGTCKAQQNLSIIPPKQPLRCTSEPYRLTNGQREEGPSVCGKLSRGQQAAVRANQQQGISAVLVHGCINLRKRCCQHEIFIVETILQKKLS